MKNILKLSFIITQLKLDNGPIFGDYETQRILQRILLHFRPGPNDKENGYWAVFLMRVIRLLRWDLFPIKTLPQNITTDDIRQTTRRQKRRQRD